MSNEQEGSRVIYLDEVVSTNSHLRKLIGRKELPEGSALVAGFQTAGRGQVGNTWESEAGRNLIFSLVLYPEGIPANHQFLISQIAALSVKETLDAYVEGITVKWPNDIYWNDRKICGMLIENDLSGWNLYCSVIGIGLNLNQETFRSDAPNPVSLKQITGKEYDWKEFLNRFLSIMYSKYLLLLQEKYDEIRTAYHTALYRRDGIYHYKDDDGEFDASIDSIEPTGHLLLRLSDDSLRRYAFKEVSYVK